MAHLAEQLRETRSGLKLVLRSAWPSDARAVVRYTRRVLATSDHLIQTAPEYGRGWLQERRVLKLRASDPDNLVLLALQDGMIVGMLDTITDRRKRAAHIIRFGLTVDANWRGRGIGSEILDTFLDWATSHPRLERAELTVVDGNRPAEALYKSRGFALEGRRRRAVSYEDGRYSDEIWMARWVGPKEKASAASYRQAG